MSAPAKTLAKPSGPGGTRRRLPNRREHELIDFEYEGHRYTGGLGRFPDGRLAELFVNTSGRAGGMIEVLAATAPCLPAWRFSTVLSLRCCVEQSFSVMRTGPRKLSEVKWSPPIAAEINPNFPTLGTAYMVRTRETRSTEARPLCECCVMGARTKVI